MDNKHSIAFAKQQAIRYCSYQERTIAAVEKKLVDWNIEQPAINEIIQTLKEARLLDEKRYIETFVRGRFINKKWGRQKIYYELVKKQLNISDIQEGLKHIEEDKYLQNLQQLIIQKKKKLANLPHKLANQKIIAFLLQKGYEFELIQQTMQID